MIWQSAVSAHVWKLKFEVDACEWCQSMYRGILTKTQALRSTRLFQLWSKSYCNCRLSLANSLGLRSVYMHLSRYTSTTAGPSLARVLAATFPFLFTISYTHCSKKTWKTQASRRRYVPVDFEYENVGRFVSWSFCCFFSYHFAISLTRSRMN